MHRATTTASRRTVSEPSQSPRPPERRVRILLDRVLSASAGVVALSALAVSVYQTAIMREQQRMSAWPYVLIQNAWAKPSSGYSIRAMNQGLGPALVRSIEVRADGVPQETWEGAARVLLGRHVRVYFSTLHRGSVLLPGADRAIAEIPVDSDAVAFWTAAQQPLRSDSARGRLEIFACYCSLYGECWQNDSNRDEPARVKACREPRTPWRN
jgi:hypothetical protein